jgi:hypothetical protein
MTESSSNIVTSAPNLVALREALHVDFYKSERDTKLRGLVREQMEVMEMRVNPSLPIWPDNKFAEQKAVLVVGDTGTGKTRAVKKCLDVLEFPNKATLRSRSLFVTMPPTYSSKELAKLILQRLHKLGTGKDEDLEFDPRASDSTLWAMARGQLAEHRMDLLIIDEFARWRTMRVVSPRGRDEEAQRLAESLNGILTADGWSVGLILIGSTRCLKLLTTEHFKHVNRRTKFVEFDDMDGFWPGRLDVALDRYCTIAGIKSEINVKYKLAHRVIVASNRAVGVAIEYLRDAVMLAVTEGRKELLPVDFANVFASRNSVPNGSNPFLVTDWKKLAERTMTDFKELDANWYAGEIGR